MLTWGANCVASIPLYLLSLFEIAIGFANRLEKMMRDFLWSGVEDSSRDHLINWGVCCRSLEEGGLGIGHLV